MNRKLKTVVVATNNMHKVDEIASALDIPGWEFATLRELGIESNPEETGDRFIDNALIKARAAHELTGLAAIADDSGLEVDVLDARPGVHSSRYAGDNATDAMNNAKLLGAMEGIAEDARTARFVSVVVYIDENGVEYYGRGECHGYIGDEPIGDGGFGYDPLFWPNSTPGLSMAQLAPYQKNACSHRGEALRQLKSELENRGCC